MTLTDSDPIVITVLGGVAEIIHNPRKIKVLVIDWDNIEAGGPTHCPDCGKRVDVPEDDVMHICPHCKFDLDEYR